VALFGFIMLVLGVPLTIAGNWQLVQSVARWMRRVRFERRQQDEPVGVTPDVAKEIALEEFVREVGKLKETMTPPDLPRAPRWIMRPGSQQNHGGAVSTGSVWDPDAYMESVLHPAVNTLSLKNGRWTAGTTDTT
jgi:hypothetical protein